MATEGTPKQGQRVTVWSDDGKPVYEGVITTITPKSVGKPGSVTITEAEPEAAT